MATYPDSQNNPNNVQKVKRFGSGRINDDWEYLQENQLPQNPTIDQKFNIEYKSKGIKSTDINKPEKVKVEQKQDGSVESTYRSKVAFIQQQREQDYIEEENFQIITREKKKTSKAVKLNAKNINRGIFTWMMFLYIALQLPLAVFSTVSFGIIGLTDSVSNLNMFTRLVSSVIKGVADAVTNFVFGFSTDELFAGIFLILTLVLMAIFFITSFTIYMIHTMAGNKPLFGGEKTTLKIGTFLLFFIGSVSVLPLIAFFPWFLGWLYVIEKYPR